MAKELEVLKELGWRESESRVYLSLLSLGNSTATLISEDVEIDRSMTYDLLKRLIKKGVVGYIVKDGIKYFYAADPKTILMVLKEKETQLESIMPSLIARNKKEREEVNVEVFKGRAAIGYVTNMVLKDKKNYFFIGAGHELCELAPIMIYKFVKEACELGLKGRLICEESFGDHSVDIVGRNETYRITSKEFTSSSTLIWGDKTAFFVFEEPYYTILIESKDIANRHNLYFKYVWTQSKEPTKEHRMKTLVKD